MIVTILVTVLAVIADQVSKHFLGAFLRGLDTQSYPLLPDILHLTYVENRGAAFGMLADHRWVFMILSVLGIAAILLLVAKEKPESRWVQLAAGLIVGGGIGNMIDRVRLGYVIDFIDCRFVDFYVFNIADCCVTVGCGLYMLLVVIETIRDRKKKKASADGEEPAQEDAGPSENGDA